MHSTDLKSQAGHLYVSIDGHDWLLDTGAPTSFGDIKSLYIGKIEFTVPESYMGLNATQLSEFVCHSTMGIIGADVLNEFCILIDVGGEQISFATNEIKLAGDILEIEEFMGIPIVSPNIGGANRRMIFDTGAQISYLQNISLNTFPSAGIVNDFYPGVGQFQTETYMVDVSIGTKSQQLRCGSLPELLGMTLMMTGTEGIIGNEILRNSVAGYFPKQKQFVLA